MRRAIYILIPLLLVFSGCFKDDEPVIPFDRGDAKETLIEMGQGYTNQVYYSLDEEAVVKTSDRMEWDISLDCKAGSETIRINTSRGMYAADISDKVFEDVTDTSGLEFKWDVSSGNPDSTAIKLVNGEGQYVINLGYDNTLDLLGFRKVQLQYRNDSLSIKWSTMDNASLGTARMGKDSTFNTVQFSIIDNRIVQTQPPKETYDILFAQYIYYFIKEDVPYIVSGALLNPHKVEAFRLDDTEFGSVTREDLDESKLSSKLDVIGYDWKFFNLDEGVYLVDDEQIYCIRSHSDFLYKLHFIGFYNDEGISGFPRLVQQRL